MLDSTALCTSSDRTFKPGLTERTISGEGYFDYTAADDARSLDKHFNDQFSPSANNLITIGPNGDDPGQIAWLFNTKQSTFNVNEIIGDLIMTQFEAKATNDSSEYGFGGNKDTGNAWMLMSEAVTGTINGNSVDDGAGATVGYVGHCHVTADSFAWVRVKLQDAADGLSWADLATFTVFSTVGADQAANPATSVNRFVRAQISAFTGTSATVVVAIKTGFAG